jgi:hypothetical protein
MLKPYADLQNANGPKIELDYLRLVYAVSEIRKWGDNAQGYFVLTDAGMLNRLSQLEHDYRGETYAKVLRVSLDSYLRHAEQTEKTELLSGIVRTAILDTGDRSSAITIRRRMREFVLTETILGLEPDVRPVTDEGRFPFRIRWDYYGIVEDNIGDRLASETANNSAV